MTYSQFLVFANVTPDANKYLHLTNITEHTTLTFAADYEKEIASLTYWDIFATKDQLKNANVISKIISSTVTNKEKKPQKWNLRKVKENN